MWWKLQLEQSNYFAEHGYIHDSEYSLQTQPLKRSHMQSQPVLEFQCGTLTTGIITARERILKSYLTSTLEITHFVTDTTTHRI